MSTIHSSQHLTPILLATHLIISQLFINSALDIEPKANDIGICPKYHQHLILYTRASPRRVFLRGAPTKYQRPGKDSLPENGRICVAMIPATPFSLSHHQNRFGSPAPSAILPTNHYLVNRRGKLTSPPRRILPPPRLALLNREEET